MHNFGLLLYVVSVNALELQLLVIHIGCATSNSSNNPIESLPKMMLFHHPSRRMPTMLLRLLTLGSSVLTIKIKLTRNLMNNPMAYCSAVV